MPIHIRSFTRRNRLYGRITSYLGDFYHEDELSTENLAQRIIDVKGTFTASFLMTLRESINIVRSDCPPKTPLAWSIAFTRAAVGQQPIVSVGPTMIGLSLAQIYAEVYEINLNNAEHCIRSECCILEYPRQMITYDPGYIIRKGQEALLWVAIDQLYWFRDDKLYRAY